VPVCVPVAVAVAVVQVGVMRMRVHQRQVAVAVRVRLAGGIARPVLVLVVFVVDVAMFVIERGVRVLVLMALGEVEVEPHCHQ